MPKRKAKTETPNNVFNIDDNPKFQPKTKKKLISLTKSTKGLGANPNAFVITAGSSIFGFAEGDTLICRADFDPNKITYKTPVIALVDGNQILTCNVGEHGEILGVVVAFQREVTGYVG